jgi:hypothetical protein
MSRLLSLSRRLTRNTGVIGKLIGPRVDPEPQSLTERSLRCENSMTIGSTVIRCPNWTTPEEPLCPSCEERTDA